MPKVVKFFIIFQIIFVSIAIGGNQYISYNTRLALKEHKCMIKFLHESLSEDEFSTNYIPIQRNICEKQAKDTVSFF